MKNNSSNSLHYDKSSQILLEAIEKVQQSIKETDAENILNRQHNQLEALSNRDAQNLDILINEIIKRVKQSKLMQTEIEMNGEILRTVKTADKSNPKNYAMETTKGKEFVQVTDEAVDPELNKIFIETTNGNKKKEEEGVKEKIYSKVKFQDQYSDVENLNKDRDSIYPSLSKDTVFRPIKETAYQNQQSSEDTYFKVDETENYIEYMKEISANKYNPEDYVQVEWDNDLLELNAQIYRSIRFKRDFLYERELQEKGKAPIAPKVVEATSKVEASVEDFDKFFEASKGAEDKPVVSNQVYENTDKDRDGNYPSLDKDLGSPEYKKAKQSEKKKKPSPLQKLKTTNKLIKGNLKEALHKVSTNVKKIKSKKSQEPIETGKFASSKAKKPKFRLEDIKKKSRKFS